MRSFAVAIALGVLLGAHTASAAGIYVVDMPDGSGSACVDLEAPKPYAFSLYVVADTGNLPLGGLVGAEFSLQGLEELFGVPPDGVLVWVAEANLPVSVVVGDPFGAGTHIVFPTCQSGWVLLFTLHMIAYDHTGLRELHVTAHQQPSNPLFDCPVLDLCDAPVYTRQCVPASVTYFDVPKVAPAATDPFPEDGATGVRRDVTLHWTIPQISAEVCEVGLIWQDIYLGTDPDPPYASSSDGPRQYTPPVLAPNTTYYWRVESGPNTSPVWQFRTEEVVAARAMTWTALRTLYR